ncbi:MAG: carboxypeptidase-like regulatory domain-containing protein [Fidelibacterota bacterium]|nr:MAG: carboxypeptidase-like regulatory domain-containing protein [Candidatus Neomarinimicrobiota bacterium]
MIIFGLPIVYLMKTATTPCCSRFRQGFHVVIPATLGLALILVPVHALTGTAQERIAQTGTISGFVRDSTNSESLSFVNVFVRGTTRGSATNRDGYYVITGAPLDTVTVVASIIGYEPARQTVDLRERPSARLDFRLTPTVLAGEEVTITAQRQRFRQSVEVSTVILDTREIQVAPAFVEADVFRTLQLLPGVQSVSDYSSAMYVRGSTPDQNLILLDGITIYNPFHLGGVFSTFNTDAIKEAEFIAGGFPARYGGRMGSVLEIINRDGNAMDYSAKANISLISSKALIEGPLPKVGPVKGSFMLAGRRTYFDKIVDLVGAATGMSKNPEFVGFPYYFYDYQAKANLDLGNRHRLTVSTFKGRDILAVEDEDEYEDAWSGRVYNGNGEQVYYRSRFNLDWSWGNTTSSLTWRWVASPHLVSKVYLAGSRFRYGIAIREHTYEETENSSGEVEQSTEELGFDIFDLVEDRTARAELTFLPNNRHIIVVGAEQKWLNFNMGWIFQTSISNSDTSFTRTDTSLWIEHHPIERAVYLEDKWRLSPQLLVKVGLRASSYSLHKGWNLEPRLGAKFFLRSDLALTASAGRYYQYLITANPGDENFRVIDLWLPAPQDQPAPSSDHLITGIEHLSERDLLLKAEVYYKTFANLVYLKQGYVFFMGPDATPGSEEVFSKFYDAKAAAHGLEFLAKKTSGKVRGWIGYTYAQTRWHTEEYGWHHPKYDRTHTLNLVADWQLTDKWHFSTAYSFATGNPYTPVLGRYRAYEEKYYQVEDYEASYTRFLVGKKNSARYPAYHRWDVSFVKRRPWWNGGFKETYIQILNVFNHMNVFQYFYSEKYDWETDQDLGIQRTAIPMFPFFPSFGVRYEF